MNDIEYTQCMNCDKIITTADMCTNEAGHEYCQECYINSGQTSLTASKNDRKDKKPDYSHLPKIFLDQVSYNMEAGAIKYGRWNYTKGHNLLQLTAAATRHLKCIEKGEDIDRDTSDRLGIDITHWACVAACALMALHQEELGTLKDDRFKPIIDRTSIYVDSKVDRNRPYIYSNDYTFSQCTQASDCERTRKRKEQE